MEEYCINESFIGHITAEFKFNVLEVFTQHFKIHNIVVLSFKPNEIIIQAMSDPGMVTDIETKGLYATTIPLQSLEGYEFDCNKGEVNVMVTNVLIESTCKVATGCNFINVVSDGLLKQCKPLVEVSFDLYEKKRRREGVHPKPISDDGSVLFGKLAEFPYLHYLITSGIDYSIRNYDAEYKSIVVRNPLQFKTFYGHEQRIFVTENGTIFFCGCHLYPAFDSTIQSDLCGSQPKYKYKYELPNKPFKHLFKFMGPLETRNKSMGIQVTNFEMLIREDPPEEVDEPESFNVGNITFYKCIPSCVKKRIAKQQKRLRNQILKLNFDKRDDWRNLSKHSHVLKGNMVLPEFVINCKYYSTHVLFERIEPLRKSEYLPPPFDNPFAFKRMFYNDVLSDRKPYVPWREMVKDGQLFLQSEALDGFYRVESWIIFMDMLKSILLLF